MHTVTVAEADAMGPHFAAVLERWFPGHVKVEHFDPPAAGGRVTDVTIGKSWGIYWDGTAWSWQAWAMDDDCARRTILNGMHRCLAWNMGRMAEVKDGIFEEVADVGTLGLAFLVGMDVFASDAVTE